ncbi:hypothetical protein Pint_26081 [Pistacia integerrima]|uniref:Uncharacterized protein n=1 Tax=Pistacia integerrima TaxID=434235 RepID=A0ACC0YF00_9ROSI|nr:hypothetical protein Pint_26081 [Pistacia integerrima]
MPKLSAAVEFMHCGMIKPAVLHCQGIGHAERHERNVELLKQKTEYLYDMRDSVKQELIKELMFGTCETMEYQKWLSKEREIEYCVNDMVRFNKENSDGPVLSRMKPPDIDLMNTLDEVTYHLENVPLGHHSVAHAPYRETKTLTSSRSAGKTYGKVENTKNVKQKSKAGSGRESNIEVLVQGKKASQKEMAHSESAQPLDKFSSKIGHNSAMFSSLLHHSEGQSRQTATKTSSDPRTGSKTYGPVEKFKNVNRKIKAERKGISNVEASVKSLQGSPASYRSSAQILKGGSVVQLEDAMTSPISSDFEEPIESLSTAFTESLSAGDQTYTSSLETKTEYDSLQTDTSSLRESEIQHTSGETNSGLSAHVAGSGETISDENERMPPIHETEFETVPAQIEGEDQMQPKFNASVEQSVESGARVAVFRSDPNSIAAVELVTASSFQKEDEIPTVNKSETEIACNIERDQQWLESGLDIRGSIERTVLKILRIMGDVTARKIGVYGIGGIGKTALLKALSSYPETKRSFDLIILVTVSRFWSMRKIQNEVLRQLSLCCEDCETDFQVAERLFHVLSRRKFLLLLDDVWEQVDLEAVGIPDPSSENGCKVLVASRKLDICHAMDVVRDVELGTLSGEEAWELFYEQVGGIIDSPNIRPFAQAIVEGCGGLPLLIVVTERALSDERSISVWEHALRKLSLPSAGIYQVEGVIQKLKFSFDQLKDHETKSFFLHCCLFSEDREVNIFEFIEYCIEEGIIIGSRADAHRTGLDIVDVLVCNFLLQLTEGGDSIKMHGLVRDLALGILSVAEGSQYLLRTAYSRLTKPSSPGGSLSSISPRSPEGNKLFVSESHQFLLRAGAGLTEAPSEEEWKKAKMIFVMMNELCTLPEKPSCPELLMLYLQRNYQLRMVPVSFFDCMTSLKVLNLSKTRIKSLPKSLFKLENLQILILCDCERLIVLPPEVGSLERLEVLDVQGTQISRLPDEIVKLASLRHLLVSFYGSSNYEYGNLPHKLISSGILSRLHLLETLSIVVYPGDQRWYEDVKSVILDVSILTELRSLCFDFPEVDLLDLFLQTSVPWKTQQLTEFKFVVGHDIKSITSRVPYYVEFDYSQQIRCLRFVNGENMSDAVLRTLSRSTAFYLDHHLCVRGLTNFGVDNVNGLNFCILSECPKIETLVDSRELTMTIFPILENLSLHYLWNLTHIWQGNLPRGSFAELKILSVHACPKVKYMFSSSMIHFVPKLEELAVEDCLAIEEIIHESEIIDSGCNTLPTLKKLTLHYLPGLVNIWTSSCAPLERISFYNCPNLKKICKDSMSKETVIEIRAEKSWWDELEWEDIEWHLHLQDRFMAICEEDL